MRKLKTDTGRPNYGNDGGGTRYSPASQIDRSNVAQLKAAWPYRTGALPLNIRSAQVCPAFADFSRHAETPQNNPGSRSPSE